MAQHQIINSESVFASPSNWKYMVFGLALILVMRWKPEGLLPSRRVQAELHEFDADTAVAGTRPEA